MKSFKIWWKDLTEETQREFLDFFGFDAYDFDDYIVIAIVDIDTEEED